MGSREEQDNLMQMLRENNSSKRQEQNHHGRMWTIVGMALLFLKFDLLTSALYLSTDCI